jgi:type VI secretion system secreted protein Hcp
MLRSGLLLAATAVLLIAPELWAAQPVLLTMKGLVQGQIECVYYEQSLKQTGAMAFGAGGGAGKVQFSDITCRKQIDRNSPTLMLAAATGQHIPEATFTIRRPNGEILTVTVLDVVITSVKEYVPDVLSAQQSGFPPLEEVTLDYAKIQWTYQGGAGKASTGWDLKQNKRL